MKAHIEDYLQNIDNYFKDKSVKDTYMTYFMVGAVIIAFGYLLLWDASEDDFKAKRQQVLSLDTKITQDKLYLQQNPSSKIVTLDKEIELAQLETVRLKDNNQYIKTKIEEISSLIYDEQTWGEYLHSISKNARKNNIKILSLKNQYSQNKNIFGHILDIDIKASGSYTNTMNFINALEQSELVIDLHTLDIEALSKLESNLKISVWGITY